MKRRKRIDMKLMRKKKKKEEGSMLYYSLKLVDILLMIENPLVHEIMKEYDRLLNQLMEDE